MALEALYDDIMENIPHIRPRQIEAVYRVILRRPIEEQAELVGLLGLDGKKTTLNVKTKYTV